MEATLMLKGHKDLFETYLIGYNSDLSKECVATVNSTGSNIRARIDHAIKKMKANGFNWIVLNRNKKVTSHSSEFERITTIPSTREFVFIYFYYIENEKTYSFCRLAKVDQIEETCAVNISLIKKHPNWVFSEYSIKEYFDHDRIKRILELHFDK